MVYSPRALSATIVSDRNDSTIKGLQSSVSSSIIAVKRLSKSNAVVGGERVLLSPGDNFLMGGIENEKRKD